jgi:mannose-6-phosphate isomerase-like protein (cupin superfamily)
MTETTRDPVHRARYAFEPRGEDIVVETWLEAGGGLPAHFHPRQVERWTVVEGEVRFQLGSEKMTLRPEDGEVVVEPGTKHALKNESGREAHLSCLATPALGLQPFLEESAAAAREGLFMRGGIPRNPRGARWAANFLKKYSDDVVMTFPPRFVQRTMTGLLAR